MLAYIKADLHRILTRVPRILLVAACDLLLCGLIIYKYFTDWSAYQFCEIANTYFKTIVPILLGLIELSAVYADDFRAKTMQVAIGIGVSRPMVVLSKLIEITVIMVIDLAIAALLAFAGAGILGAGLVAEQVGDVLVYVFIGLLQVVVFAAIAMIPMFYTQSIGLGTLLYLFCAIPLLPWLLSTVLTLGPLAQYRLDNLLVFNQMEQLGAYMLTRTFNFGVTAGIVVSLAIFYVVTVLLFRKRELEF